jgi:hypothetical protein
MSFREEDIINVVIDTEEIEEFVFNRLSQCGLVPSEEEVETIADIFFDYLLEKGVVDEVDDEDYE